MLDAGKMHIFGAAECPRCGNKGPTYRAKNKGKTRYIFDVYLPKFDKHHELGVFASTEKEAWDDILEKDIDGFVVGFGRENLKLKKVQTFEEWEAAV